MIEKVDQLLQDEPKKWINTLPGYQQKIIQNLLNAEPDMLKVAEAWLSASPSHTAYFGAAQTGKVFLDKVIDEIELFLCGDPKYDKEREQFSKESQILHQYIVGSISVAIASALGSSAAFIAPVVALVLMSLGKISLNAWCKMRKERRENASQNKSEASA